MLILFFKPFQQSLPYIGDFYPLHLITDMEMLLPFCYWFSELLIFCCSLLPLLCMFFCVKQVFSDILFNSFVGFCFFFFLKIHSWWLIYALLLNLSQPTSDSSLISIQNLCTDICAIIFIGVTSMYCKLNNTVCNYCFICLVKKLGKERRKNIAFFQTRNLPFQVLYFFLWI